MREDIKTLVDLYIQKWNIETVVKSLKVFVIMGIGFIILNLIFTIISGITIIPAIIALPMTILAFTASSSGLRRLTEIERQINKIGGKID
jgi:hypothetical protein